MIENDVKIYDVVIGDDSDKEIRRLVRKKGFKSLPKQIYDLADDIEKGELKGDVVLSYAEPTKIDVYKMRLPAPEANAGKSDGFRVVYAVAISRKLAYILTVYYKKKKPIVSDHEIRAMVNAFICEHLKEKDVLPNDTEINKDE
jgi:hypothetical protein